MKRIIIISSLTLIIVLLNINFVVPNLNDPATSIQYEQITKIDSSTNIPKIRKISFLLVSANNLELIIAIFI